METGFPNLNVERPFLQNMHSYVKVKTSFLTKQAFWYKYGSMLSCETNQPKLAFLYKYGNMLSYETDFLNVNVEIAFLAKHAFSVNAETGFLTKLAFSI